MVPEPGPSPIRSVQTGVPRLLVSVLDPPEADLAAARGADIVDAKNPDDGPLGALPMSMVSAIVSAVAGRAATSAVAGDGDGGLPASVAAMAATGVDYVKVAVSPTLIGDAAALARIASAAPGRLVAVLLAEDAADFGIAPAGIAGLAASGFAGAMLDTRGKSGQRLGDILDGSTLRGFVAACRTNGLLSGLAGSLHVGDVPVLAAHAPAYLGFRGGLCLGGDRRRSLDPARVADAILALHALRRQDAA